MKAREFAFWLQGHFELNNTTAPLTTAQAKLVLSKAEKVTASDSGDSVERSALSYVQNVKGALSTLAYVPEESQAQILTGITAKLRTDLNNLFQHAIDPSIPGDQEQHRRTHRPSGGNGPQLLC